ncbi:MAG: ATP-dependent DNA helicase RecQ [Chloroflexi bacterium RBG_16_57_11]|nr:MAG: ATP-dependent DNA helicase RecQ [Chloroflexi bacterium RBG_16_57_11]
MPSHPEAILRAVFGYEQFKPLQREVIQNVLKKRDTLVIMPTGGGKSLCYQIPALIFPGLTVVVSPLIALMKDQVEQLRQIGIPAVFLNSSLSPHEYQENMAQVRNGEIKLLYVAPETLLTPRLFNLLESLPLDCLTIDEAHCISEWGHDFRPEYRQLVAARERFPQAVCLASTATATPRVRQDIKSTLRFETSNEFIASFNRSNLLIEVQPKTDPTVQTLRFLERFQNQSGIVYCFARKQVEELAENLSRLEFSARPYHAGLEDKERKANQEAFLHDDIQIVVATIAFGMGINKPNVRFVLHFDLPKSIESYYQEIGRAGRDGLPAQCLLLYNYGDAKKLQYFIDQKEGTERQVAFEHLKALRKYAESDVCRRVPLLAYFGERYITHNCGMCDNCLAEEKKQVEITIQAQKFLSCALRSGEKFGAGHIADILLGAENPKILKFDHQNLSTYSIGKDLSRKQWLHIGDQLLQKGYLERTEHGSLRLTPEARQALKERQPILGVLLEERQPATLIGRQITGAYDEQLFEILRSRRKQLADDARLPPYVIFSDRTLIEMATAYPTTPQRLRSIFGMSEHKLKRYGQIFLEVMQAYCQEHQIEPPLPSLEKTKNAATTPGKKPRFIEVGERYNRGLSVEKIMLEYNVRRETVINHLTLYLLEGNSLTNTDGLPKSTLSLHHQENVLAEFKRHGAKYLNPIFDALQGTIDYSELSIICLYFLVGSQAEDTLPDGFPP